MEIFHDCVEINENMKAKQINWLLIYKKYTKEKFLTKRGKKLLIDEDS